jgi:hypothetical protein
MTSALSHERSNSEMRIQILQDNETKLKLNTTETPQNSVTWRGTVDAVLCVNAGTTCSILHLQQSCVQGSLHNMNIYNSSKYVLIGTGIASSI